MIYAIYETIRKDKLQRLLQFALFNDDILFIQHLLDCIHKTDFHLYKTLIYWIFLESILHDNIDCFTFLLDTFPTILSSLFVLYHTVNISCIYPHPLVYAVDLHHTSIVQFLLSCEYSFLNINLVFADCLRLSLQHHSFPILELFIDYYYKHKQYLTPLHHISGNNDQFIIDEIVRCSFDYSLISIFSLLCLHEDIIENYQGHIHELISRNNYDTLSFMDVLYTTYEFNNDIRLWLEFYIVKFDSIHYYNWYIGKFKSVIDYDEFITEIMMYDSWKIFNHLYIQSKFRIQHIIRQYFHLLINFTAKTYNILNFSITHISDIDIYKHDSSQSYLEYSLQYNLNQLAYLLLSIPNRSHFTIRPQHYSLYKHKPEIVPFLLKSEIETLLDISHGEYYSTTIPDYLQHIYHDLYLKYKPIQKIQPIDDICSICREIPSLYVLCSNTIKQHPLSIDCLEQLDTKICPYCRSDIDLSVHFLNEPHTIQE